LIKRRSRIELRCDSVLSGSSFESNSVVLVFQLYSLLEALHSDRWKI